MRTQFVCGISGILFLLFVHSSVQAQTVVRIEEDWALQVVEPDEQLDSPQITTAMMPLGPNSDVVFFLDINHGSLPDYSAGGLQLRIEQNGAAIVNSRLLPGVKLSHTSETIRWTQVAIQQGGQVKFGIVDGVSESWNHFGGTPSFISATTADGNLAEYRFTDSLSNSGAVYAGNRVASLVLLRVRAFNSFGQMIEIPVNQSPN